MFAGATYLPVVVISPQFCAPTPVDLIMVRKLISITDGNFAVADVNGNLMFKVKGKLLSVHDRRVLLDSQGNPIVSLRQKVPFHLIRILQFHPFIKINMKYLVFVYRYWLHIMDGKSSEEIAQTRKFYFLLPKNLQSSNSGPN